MKFVKPKIQLKDIVYSIIFTLGFITSVILANEKNYEKVNNIVPGLDKLIDFSLPILLAIIPIAIGIATFIYQIYYNRYTLKDFKRALKSEFIWLVVLSTTELVSIFIFWLSKEKIIFLYFEILFLLFFLIVKFIIFIFRYNKFSIEGYVVKYTNKSIALLQSEKVEIKQIKQLLMDINEYFTESIEKKENNYIRLIIDSKQKIFSEYLICINKLLLKESLSKEDEEKITDIFINSLSRDFKYLYDNNSSKKIMSIYAVSIIKTIEETITCNREDLFKKIIFNLTNCFHYTNKNDFPLNYFIEIFEDLYQNSLKQDDRKYAKIIENEVLKLFVSIIHEAENSEVEQRLLLANERISFLSLKSKDKNIFTEVFAEFVDKVSHTITYFSKKESEILVGIFMTIYEEIKKSSNVEHFNIVVDNLFRLIDSSMQAKNKDCINYLGYALSIYLESDLYKKIDEIEDKRFRNFLRSIRVCPEDSMIYLPDYKHLFSKYKKNVSEMKQIRKQIDMIFRELLSSDKLDVISYYLDYFNNCIYELEIDDKDAQKLFIDLYEDLLIRTIRSDTSAKFDMVMSYFDDLLVYLDKERKISTNLLDIIMHVLDNVGCNLLDTDDFALQSYFLNYFRHLPENLNIIKNKEQKQRITEILFHFTVSTLESKNEKSLKICSNNIGWYAVFLEDNGDFESYKIAVDTAKNMYNLAVEENYDKSTVAFLGTLFIVLGAYAISRKGISYADYVKACINKVKDKETLKISKELRYFEYKYWDSTFKGDAKSAISNFYKQLNIN